MPNSAPLPAPPPTNRCGTIHTPAPRQPRLVQFDLQTIAIEIPSRTTDRIYRVTSQGVHAPKCPCPATKPCWHLKAFSDYLFSPEGMRATLQMVEAQIADVKPGLDSISCYQLGALLGIKQQIEARLAPEPAAFTLNPCPNWRTKTKMEMDSEAEFGDCYDDSDPFADMEPVVVAVPVVRDFNYYHAGLAL